LRLSAVFVNPVITGWANYYKTGTSAETFQRVDWEIFRKIWQWSRRRHPNKCKGWVKDKYYRTINNQKWRFAAELEQKKKGDLKYFPLVHLTAINTKKHVKIRHDANPYDTQYLHYFEERSTRKMLEALKGKDSYKKYMWEGQKRKCPVCGETLNLNASWSLVQKFVDGRMEKHLIHDHCIKNMYQSKKEVI